MRGKAGPAVKIGHAPFPLAKWLGIAGIVAASIGTTIASSTQGGNKLNKQE